MKRKSHSIVFHETGQYFDKPKLNVPIGLIKASINEKYEIAKSNDSSSSHLPATSISSNQANDVQRIYDAEKEKLVIRLRPKSKYLLVPNLGDDLLQQRESCMGSKGKKFESLFIVLDL